MKEQNPILLFDGVCVLCNRTVRFLMRRNRGRVFRFAALDGETALAVFVRHPELARDDQSVVLVEDFGQPGERVLQRSDAALQALRLMGGGWRVAGLLKVCPRRLRDGVYRFVARRRYRWFGKLSHCPVPRSDEKTRFLP